MATENNDENCEVCYSVEDITKTLPSDEILEDNAALLKSLADPARLKIVYLLKNGELCVCQILEAIDKSQSTISHHLKMMKKERVLSARKQGKWIYYKLANENIIDSLEQIFEKGW
ncbi:ArsR/SmtB family transcription factor [Methanobrevibacter woesei]|uniref:ArsR/SmtB family transcription factor n=1 Tax=Methanobrevibacter woesei TaxID=190976 RepID=UPI00235208D8|nr:metalloregulator ArsR/SmtB family transcription factor [Methanobrevibacter woesei]